jgi:hypothetical protein
MTDSAGHAADECLRLKDLRGATATVACALAELLVRPSRYEGEIGSK